MSTRSPRPSIAELRAVTQPAAIFARHSGEHWAGRLYVRRYSPYLTRLLIPTPITPNGVTWLMIAVGVLAAAALSVPHLWAAVVAVVLIQGQILLDCADGELARWRRTSSPVGIYLDRLGHYVTETLFPIALGVRADGGWDSLGPYTTLGLIAALLALFVRTLGALVAVARLESGLGRADDTAAGVAPRGSVLGTLKRWIGRFPVFRVFIAIEATLVSLAAAIADAADGSQAGTRVLVIALVPIAAITAAGRLLAIVTSARLRAAPPADGGDRDRA